jgi:hypothetical protein
MITYQWTSTVIGVILAITIFWLVRRNHLHPRIAIWWILMAVVVAVVGSSPKLVDWVAIQLGISYSPTLVNIVALGVILIKILRTDITRTKDHQKMQVLAQEIAIYKERLLTLEAGLEKRSD